MIPMRLEPKAIQFVRSSFVWIFFTFSAIWISFQFCQEVYSQSTIATFGEGFTEDGRSPLLEYTSKKRLRVEIQATDIGLRVTHIYDNSPVLRLRSPADRNLVASMEIGDVIVSLNGDQLKTPDDLVQKLQTSGKECEITVWDVNTKQAILWLVEPASTFSPVIVAAPTETSVAKVHIVLAAATLDERLGDEIAITLGNLEQFFTSEIDPSRLSMTILNGTDCTALGIARGIDKLKVGFNDSLLVYYMGHGAYDARLQEKDPYEGQFFDFPSDSTDLLRRAVWSHLDVKPARLKVLVSDSCNVKGVASGTQHSYTVNGPTQKTVTEATNLEWLMLGHTGTLDINAASRNEYAWYSKDVGGWFTTGLVRLMNKDAKWDVVTSQLPSETNRIFQVYKKSRLGIAATTNPLEANALNQQLRMTPIISADLARDETAPFPVGVARKIGRIQSDSNY